MNRFASTALGGALIALAAGAIVLAIVALGTHSANADTVATSVASGGNFSCAVTGDGGAKCWGIDDIGQLGTGSATAPDVCNNDSSSDYPCSKTPVDVTGLTSGVRDIAAGQNHACAIIDPDGGVKCWGANQFGQLGGGQTGPDTCHTASFDYPCSLSPVTVSGLTDVIQLDLGVSHSCARTSAKEVWCWGLSAWGELGAAGGDTCGGVECSFTPVKAAVSNVLDVAAGGFHTCVSTEQAGAKCFGMDSRGQLGNGSLGPDSCLVGLTAPCSKSPVAVHNLTDVIDITAGDNFTCAITDAGVKCWGDNFDAQLGVDNGNKNCGLPSDQCYSATPVTVAGASGDFIAAGSRYTCTGPTVQCWGTNRFGELDGTSGPDTCDSGFKCSYAPRSIAGLGANVTQLATDTSHTCVVESADRIECWGYGFYGQMGNGENESDNPTPQTPTGFDGESTTPTPGANLVGDTDCDGSITGSDGALVLGFLAGVRTPGCIAAANVKCNDDLTPLDALLIFQYLADTDSQLPGTCRAIGT
ncbi:MAG: hypothetical protein ABI559_07370 [Chloroflexota bacterium]